MLAQHALKKPSKESFAFTTESHEIETGIATKLPQKTKFREQIPSYLNLGYSQKQ